MMKRDVNGVLLLNKPTGKSSNAVLQQIKWLYQAKKAGHTGSLDPLASGMLPICLGEATKFANYFLTADKSYYVTAKLGITTDTYDAEGQVVSCRSVDHIKQQQIIQICQQFVGEIEQVPPMFSALKHQGKPLYELARKGQQVAREARNVSIYELQFLSLQQQELSLYVKCSKGTYIRSLIFDIGNVLGCGAHVIKLHRDSVADLQAHQMINLVEVESAVNESQFTKLGAWLLPSDILLPNDWPSLTVTAAESVLLQCGQLLVNHHSLIPSWVKLYVDGNFFGIGEILENGMIAPRRMLSMQQTLV